MPWMSAVWKREVYDHLFSFFRRYYSEGDFLAKRVYKPGVYAIPYEGEEVTLHWATGTNITSRPASTCATTPSGCGQTTTRSRCVCTTSGWPMPPRGSTATSRRPKARTASSSLLPPANPGAIHRRGKRRARHPVRVPPRNARRLAEEVREGKSKAAHAEGLDCPCDEARACVNDSSTLAMDRGARQAARHRERRERPTTHSWKRTCAATRPATPSTTSSTRI